MIISASSNAFEAAPAGVHTARLAAALRLHRSARPFLEGNLARHDRGDAILIASTESELDIEMTRLGEWLDAEMPAVSKFIEELRNCS